MGAVTAMHAPAGFRLDFQKVDHTRPAGHTDRVYAAKAYGTGLQATGRGQDFRVGADAGTMDFQPFVTAPAESARPGC